MFFLKKNYKAIILLFVLLILLAYVVNITSIPNSLILFQNQSLQIKPILGITIEESIPVGVDLAVSNNQTGEGKNINLQEQYTQQNTTKEYNLNFLGWNIKKIKANIISNTKVVPIGKLIGLKLYTKGVLVVGVSEIKGEDNKIYKPYEEAGIKQGDTILKINDESVETTDELIACVSKNKGNNIRITYINDGQTLETTMKPVKTSKNTYKIGLWVRDAAARSWNIDFL